MLLSRATYSSNYTCIAQGHIDRIFDLLGSGIRTSDLSVICPTFLTASLLAAPKSKMFVKIVRLKHLINVLWQDILGSNVSLLFWLYQRQGQRRVTVWEGLMDAAPRKRPEVLRPTHPSRHGHHPTWTGAVPSIVPNSLWKSPYGSH
jgi:hypothetical protein